MEERIVAQRKRRREEGEERIAEQEREPNNFQLYAKKLFLTYPKCQTPVQECKNKILEIWPAALVYIAQEKHQDSSLHLHVLLHLETKPRFRGLAGLEKLRSLVISHHHPQGLQGNFQCQRGSLREAILYLQKNPVDFWTNMDVEAILKKKNSKCTDIVNLVKEGKGLKEIDQEYPEFVLMHMQKVKDYLAQVQVWKLSDNLKILQAIVKRRVYQDLLMEESMIRLTTWLTLNVLPEVITQRKPRQKQLYLHGPPGIGKSRMISQLTQFLRIYSMPRDEEFYDAYDDDSYDLAVLDEFKHSKTIQWLNGWLDGNPMPIRKKGSQGIKKKNLPTIIISNFSLQQNYRGAIEKNSNAIDSLADRLEIIEVTQEFELNFIEINDS